VVNEVVRTLREGAKRVVHDAGALPAYHRVRNRRRLTVLTFHRVLEPSDARWADADKEWSVTVEQLASCVAFVQQHYTIISLDELLAARRRGESLPPCPALLTFDDGWADNEEHALPVLEAARVPAVIFVSGDAVGRDAPFWRESLRAAFLGGRIDDETWRAFLRGVSGPAGPCDEAALERLLDRMSGLTRAQRDALLVPLQSRIDDGRRHMLAPEQLRHLRDRGVAVGAHGRTHEPLDRCEDLDDELRQPRRRLGELLDEPITTLALPHSRFDAEVIRQAARVGYELVFTGEPKLAPVRPVPFTIGRIPITPGAITDARGRFRRERLALHLFRREHLSAWG
jgi:peptidoglycan/xylan/chitin deacetylase (PgdA/CDA1 family)